MARGWEMISQSERSGSTKNWNIGLNKVNIYFEMLTFFFWENYARVSHKSVSANLTQIGDKFSWQVNLWFIVPKWHEIELKWRERWEMFFEYFHSNRMLHHFEPEPVKCYIQSCSLIFATKNECYCHVLSKVLFIFLTSQPFTYPNLYTTSYSW